MKRRPEKSHTADGERFARAMADVRRLAPDPRGRVRTAPEMSAPRPALGSPSSTAGPDEDESAEAGFVAPGVDRRELRKLKRGDYTAGDALDVHGQTAAEAVAHVKQFLDTARHRHRCIAIVHGKGLHSAGHLAILKARVRECLRHQPAVLAYADAPRGDGGSGAVYVLLRK